MIELTAEEARVLGALVEKEATVPDTYPMTVKALRAACNQSSSRDPVVAYDESTVQRVLDSTKAKGLTRFVYASHGARTTRHRHVLDEALGLDRAELAVLSVLLLRGPQTAGELRGRTERQHAFDTVAEVEATLSRLAGRDEPLVRLLHREPGRREPRWTQLLTPNAAPPSGGAPTPDAAPAGLSEVGPDAVPADLPHAGAGAAIPSGPPAGASAAPVGTPGATGGGAADPSGQPVGAGAGSPGPDGLSGPGAATGSPSGPDGLSGPGAEATVPSGPPEGVGAAAGPSGSLADAGLRQEVEDLRRRVADLERRLADLLDDLGA